MSRIFIVDRSTVGRRTLSEDGDQLRILENVTLSAQQNPILARDVDNVRIDVRGSVISTLDGSNSVQNYAANMFIDNSSVFVYSTGVIDGAVRGIRMEGDDNLLRNDGVISATYTVIDFGSGTIVNTGTIESADAPFSRFPIDGIIASGQTHILNTSTGIIRAEQGDAISLSLTEGSSVDNRGLIETTDFENAVFGGRSFIMNNYGTVRSDQYGVRAGTDSQLSNYGAIVGGNNSGAALSAFNTSTFDNFGTLGGASGVEVRYFSIAPADTFNAKIINRNDAIIDVFSFGITSTDVSIDVHNSGDIFAGRTAIIAADLELFNTGLINARTGVELQSGDIRNSGAIDALNTRFPPFVAIKLTGEIADDVLIVNSGSILGPVAIESYGTEVDLRNSGTITGDILLADGRDFIVNSGSIDGDLLLEGGRDRYIGTGGSVDGIISGGAGDDIFSGGTGVDIFDGGEGRDFVIFSGARADYELTLAENGSLVVTDNRVGAVTDGTDTLINIELVRFSDGNFSVDTLTRERIIIPTDQTGDLVLSALRAELVVQSGATLTGVIGGPSGTVTGSSATVRIDNDGTIAGPEAAVDLSNLTGPITISNRGQIEGDVRLGSGDDTLITVRGTINGDIFTGAGNDSVSGSALADIIFGEAGSDALRGGGGEDFLVGGAGDDVLNGGSGSDDLNGGSGDDRLYGRSGDDVIDGGDGSDIARYAGNQADFGVTDNGNGTFTVSDLRAGGPEGTDTLTNVEILQFDDGIFTFNSSLGLIEAVG